MSEDALQHELPLLCRGGGEQGPDMSNTLLVTLGKDLQFLDFGQHDLAITFAPAEILPVATGPLMVHPPAVDI